LATGFALRVEFLQMKDVESSMLYPTSMYLVRKRRSSLFLPGEIRDTQKHTEFDQA